MQALLIDPAKQTIEAVEIAGHEDIARLIGFDTIESDDIGPDGDRLYFDEECFLRGAAVSGRFQVKGVAPVAGKGLVVGSADDGATLRDPAGDADGLRARLSFL